MSDFQSRPAALDALEAAIRAAVENTEAKFFRNPEGDVDASTDGVVIMTDGDPGEPEYILGPFGCAWEHAVEFELTASGEDRKDTIEALIALFDPALAVDRSLGGKVDDARIVTAPDFAEYPVDGAQTERSAVLRVQLSYTTASGAG